jgi:hypothetical protein
MRIVQGICLVLLGAGCAHRVPAASATALPELAEESYKALNFTACAEQFRLAAETGADDSRAESFYRAAGCAALAGDSSQALELLKRSAQSGYFDPDHLRFNPELTSLHSLAGWQEVLASVEANRSKAPNPPMPVAVLSAIDVYGSRRANTEAVRRVLGLEVGKPTVPSKAIFQQQQETLRKQFTLAFAKVNFTYFFAGPDEGRAYVIVDLVDAEDAQRLRFLPAPTGHLEDPEGLIAQWEEYETKSFQLLQQGKLDQEKPAVCRVAHCILGFDHPELAPFEPRFLEKVPLTQDALTRVLREDASGDKRAAAAFLLAYAATPEQSVARLVPSIRDPSGSVRNNVLRVLTATQQKADHPLVELATVVDALSMPETLDRNKSLYLLEMLLEDLKPEELKAQRAPLIRQLGARLVDMASLQNPIIRDPASEVLQLLSGEKHETPEQWKAWLAGQGR